MKLRDIVNFFVSLIISVYAFIIAGYFTIELFYIAGFKSCSVLLKDDEYKVPFSELKGKLSKDEYDGYKLTLFFCSASFIAIVLVFVDILLNI